RLAGSQGLCKRLARLPGEHEHLAGRRVLHDARDETALVVGQLVGADHATSSSGQRMGNPRFAHSSFTAATDSDPKWNTVATRALWDPVRRATPVRSAGSASAALFSETLSAPARSSASASETVRTPPPTAKGIESSRATRSTRATRVPRFSNEALMSRKHTS